MKKTINKEVHICDKCGKEGYVQPCLHCGVEMCYECRQVNGTEYSQGVFTQGSGDGFYCRTCDNELVDSVSDARHNAYRAIHSLKVEARSWNADFERRREDAEKNLRMIR